MPAEFFIDSNVLIYGFSGREPEKQRIARALSEAEGAWVSTQVLSEVGNVLIRKFSFAPGDARARVASISTACDVLSVTPALVLDAFRIVERYRVGLFDAQIIAAALACGAQRLYTEDLHDGLVIDGMKITSPFMFRARAPSSRYGVRRRLRRAA
jgi:predicted nucleic acid-binding protein